MIPEVGDKNVVVTRADVTAALGRVGVEPGDTVLFHSSLSSMGRVEGGADAVIDGFLDAVGPTGTVAVPTLCNWRPGEEGQVFPRWDPARTPSYVGRITEVFRTRPGAVRSDHATHSVAALGARAAELTAGHGAAGPRPGPFGQWAFAHESPWERLYQWNAAYAFIGVTFRVCTMVHYVESRVVERVLDQVDPVDRPRLAQEVADWLRPGVWPSIPIDSREWFEALLAARGEVRYDRIGSATLRCARTRTLVDRWLELIEAEPERWLSEPFLAWLKRAR